MLRLLPGLAGRRVLLAVGLGRLRLLVGGLRVLRLLWLGRGLGRSPVALRSLLLGADEVLGDQRGEVEVRLAGLGPHQVEVHFARRREVLVDGTTNDTAAAGLKCCTMSSILIILLVSRPPR
ncbi:hypothetical protein ACFSNO_29805 [Streptomyces cirratus]